MILVQQQCSSTKLKFEDILDPIQSLKAFQTSSPMSWIKNESGSFKRPLVHTEYMYHLSNLGAGGCEVQLTAITTVETTFVESELVSRLRKAWIAIHYKYPQVASLIEGFDFVYTPLKNEEDVAAWLDETFIVRSDVIDPIDITAILAPRPKLYYLPLVKKIIILSGHPVIDAIGTALFFNEFFAFVIENKDFNIIDLDSARLTRPLEAVIDGDKLTQPHQDEVDSLIAKFATGFPTMGADITQTNKPPKSLYSDFLFTTEETTKIIKKAGAKGYTVTTASHAAFIEVLNEHEVNCKGEKAIPRYGAFTFINLRPWISNSDAAKHPFSPYHATMPISYSLEGNQQDRVDRAHKYFEEFKKAFRDDVPTDTVPFNKPLIAQFGLGPNILMPWMDPVRPANPNVLITSSFGVVDEHLTFDDPQLHVVDYWLYNYVQAQRVVLSLWSFKGRLAFNLGYNEAFYETSYIDEMQSKIQVKLHEILA